MNDAVLATSKAELARLVEVTKPAVTKWLRRSDWPFAQEPPWDVEQVKLWRAQNLQPNRASILGDLPAHCQPHEIEMPALAKAKLAYESEKVAYLRLRREILARKYVPEERILLVIHTIKSAMLAIPRIAKFDLNPQNPELAERILTQAITDAFNELADGKDPDPCPN